MGDAAGSVRYGKSALKKGFWFLVRILFAAGIIFWLVRSNMDGIRTGFANIGRYWYWLIPAVLLYVSHMLVCAWRWKVLADVIHIKLTLWEAVTLTMKGYFFSLVVPGGAIGGDLAKIGFMTSRSARGTRVEGAFSILMDRITGMAALFGIAIVVILLSIPQLMKINLPGTGIELTESLRVLFILGLLGLCAAGILAMFAIFNHRTLEKIKLLRLIKEWMDRKSGGAASRMCEATDQYANGWKTVLWLSVIGIVFVHLNLVAVVVCLMEAIGVESYSLLGVTSAVIIASIAGLIPFTPGGVGLRDVTMKELLVAAGVGASAATVPILFTSIMIICHVAAGLFFIVDISGRGEKRCDG
jgi:hypothetical protein